MSFEIYATKSRRYFARNFGELAGSDVKMVVAPMGAPSVFLAVEADDSLAPP